MEKRGIVSDKKEIEGYWKDVMGEMAKRFPALVKGLVEIDTLKVESLIKKAEQRGSIPNMGDNGIVNLAQDICQAKDKILKVKGGKGG